MAEPPAEPPAPLDRRPLLIGMVHLAPTPGAPAYRAPDPDAGGWMQRTIDGVASDAEKLADAGFDALLIENFGDAPFFPGRVPAQTVASMTLQASIVADMLADRVALGVNVLRNDALSALGIAAAVELEFIRVNVLAGAYVTDQGLIEGRAAEVARTRAQLVPRARIFADLRVKHARPLAPRPIEEEARELVERAGADAIIVSGTATGAPVDPDELAAVRSAVGSHPVLVGSGATVESVRALLQHADGVIVGTALKEGGVTTAPVDADRARAFVRAARG